MVSALREKEGAVELKKPVSEREKKKQEELKWEKEREAWGKAWKERILKKL